ncbi:MAG: hypothetical protein DME48_08840 [Verrucomicrobia bacterium]|nr:MAG: hypothetical protein DME48_08840 [Verrucomicrobiota bacterium]
MLRPETHPFFYRANRAKNQPQQRDNPSGVENRSKPPSPKNARGPGIDPRNYRQEREGATAHPKEECNGFANRGRT